MKPFVLNHLPVVFEEVHTKLEMLAAVNVCGHYLIVGTREQDLAEQFD